MLRGPFGRLLRALFAHPRSVILGIIGALVVIGTAAVVPLLIGETIGRAVRGEGVERLLPLIAWVVGLSGIKAIGIYIRKRWAGDASVRTEARLRAQMYEHLQGLDIAYHERVPTGSLMSRASSDLQQARDFLAMIPITIAMSVFVVVVTVILLLKDPPLAFATLIGLPVMAYSAARLTFRLHPEVYGTQQNLARLTATAEESVTGIRVVKAFGREDHQIQRLDRDASRVFDRAVAVVRIRALLQPLFDFWPAISLAVVLWFGGYRVMTGAIDIAGFVAFFMYVTQLQWPVRLTGWIASDAQKAATAAKRIFEVLDVAPGIEDRPGAEPLETEEGDVRFEGVRYSFTEDRPILNGIDLDIPAGGSVALVGPTGCGKTTILRLILRFLEPEEGRILVGGSDLSGVTLDSLRRQIGTVFEDTFLFSDTIAANIAFGRPEASEDEIVKAAVLAQAHGFISDLPDGYGTVVGEQGFTLSGGQRQRIAIARAILMDPKVLLLDDATSAVDPNVEAEIRRGLAEAMSARTTLIVARRPASAALADRVVYLEKGSIVAQGTHEELWGSTPAYREVLTGSTELAKVGAPKEAVGT